MPFTRRIARRRGAPCGAVVIERRAIHPIPGGSGVVGGAQPGWLREVRGEKGVFRGRFDAGRHSTACSGHGVGRAPRDGYVECEAFVRVIAEHQDPAQFTESRPSGGEGVCLGRQFQHQVGRG